MVVAAPVVAGCALLGSLIGTTHPLQSMFSATRPGGELSDLRLPSVRSVEPPAVAPEPSPEPSREPSPPSPEPSPEPSSGPPAAAPALPPGPAHDATGSQVAAPVPARPAASVVAVSTGSVDRPPPAGGSGDVATTQGNRPELVPPEGASRATNQSHRQARAKRLRRMLGRHTRPKSAGSQVDAFISSILPAK
jgi:hypothetical protein